MWCQSISGYSLTSAAPESLETIFCDVSVSPTQQMPVILAGNDAQKKKYLGRMTEEPLMCVSKKFCQRIKDSFSFFVFA